MIILSRRNVISGLIVVCFGLLLYSQTFGLENAMTSEGIHPMDYPRMLITLFILAGLCIALIPPAHEHAPNDGIPLFSPRTAAVAGFLAGYAALLDVIGFGVTSFATACGIGYAMGWQRIKVLVLSNAAGIVLIWALFRYVLKIPLPTGLLF